MFEVRVSLQVMAGEATSIFKCGPTFSTGVGLLLIFVHLLLIFAHLQLILSIHVSIMVSCYVSVQIIFLIKLFIANVAGMLLNAKVSL